MERQSEFGSGCLCCYLCLKIGCYFKNMEGKNPIEYYEGIKDGAEKELARLSRLTATVSVARLAIVIAAIACIWAWWGEAVLVGSTLAVGVVLFLVLVIKHNKLFGKIAMQKALNQVATDNMRRINLELDTLDGVGEYVNPRHEYSYDLDLFGQRSIFTLLNSTATKGGERLLAGSLVKPELSAVEILKRQEAIKELAGMESFRIRFQALGLVAKGDNETDMDMSACNFANCKLRQWQTVSIFLFPSVLAILVVMAVLGLDVSVWIETCAVLSLVVASLGSKKVGQLHDSVDKVVNTVSIYHNLLSEIENGRFESELMMEFQSRLRTGDELASEASRKLAKLLSNMDQRYNWLSYLVLNILLQWDYRQARNVERWIARHEGMIGRWHDVLCKVDELCALATFAFNNPSYTFPKIDGHVIIAASRMGHPLIDAKRCVRNDVGHMECGNFLVVTGANMAGKSTYLRTVGVNYLLALIGAPVCAIDMIFTPAHLFTGLRTTDSLNDNESYFFAELRRLQTIINRAEHGERMLVILDEILKGTNSADKQKGSLALVRKLVKMNVAGIIATHDLVLGNLADEFPGMVSNRCFEAEIKDDTLKFDYKLHEGVAHNLNAYFLMQRMGIV